MTETLRRRLAELDDPARWLGFFSTAIHFQHPVMTAMAIADEAYINDFPENVNSERRGQKDMSWSEKGESYFSECPRDEGGHCKPSGQGDEKIGKGSTGDVVARGDKVVKKATRKDGNISDEGKIYEMLKGVSGIASGEQRGMEIVVERFRNIVSRDDVSKDKRVGVGRFLAKKIPQIDSTINELSKRGIAYDDVLQFGFNQANDSLKLFDFSNAGIVSVREAVDSNLQNLTIFYEDFGLPVQAETVQKANQLFRNSQEYEEDNFLDEEENEIAKNIVNSVGPAKNIYHGANARTIGLTDVNFFQVPHDGKRTFVVSDRPLSEKEKEKWELSTLIELGHNDFPEERKNMSWLANDRGGALVAPPALGKLRKRKSVPLPRVRSKAVYDAVLRETGSKRAAKKLSEEKTWIDLK